MSKDLKFFGAHRADGKPDDCVIAHIHDDGKITYEVQGNFAALMIAAVNHANENQKFRSELGQLAVATEMADDNISLEEAYEKIKHIKPISGSSDEDQEEIGKKITKRELLAGLHDPMDTKLNLVTYEDTSVDIEIQGNKAGMIIQLLSLAQNNPEAVESIIDMLGKVADLNLHVFQDGGMENCVVVSGRFHDVLDDMCSKEEPIIKAVGLKKLIEQIENQNDILEFLDRVKKEPDFPHKDDIIALAYYKLVSKIDDSNMIIDILAEVQKNENLPHKEDIISLGSNKLKNKFSSGASC